MASGDDDLERRQWLRRDSDRQLWDALREMEITAMSREQRRAFPQMMRMWVESQGHRKRMRSDMVTIASIAGGFSGFVLYLLERVSGH